MELSSMAKFNSKVFNWVFLLSCLLTFSMVSPCCSLWCPTQYLLQTNREFERKTDRFWEYEEESNTWVELKLPFDLLSCVNNNCTKVGTIDSTTKNRGETRGENRGENRELNRGENRGLNRGDEFDKENVKRNDEDLEKLDLRKKISLTKMAETSIWVTGESGTIYERFWNGIQWVIAPHDFPISFGHVISVFTVNHTIFALSQSGKLYQMQLSESSQSMWIEFMPTTKDQNSAVIQIKSGVLSNDGLRIYFCTKAGSLLELNEIEPPTWVNHGTPPGANVAAVADGSSLRPQVLFTISSSGDLYEYDRNSKPSWKKHIKREGSERDTSLIPSMGLISHSLKVAHSISIFLITKGGGLVERRLHQRKWKWVFHGSPKKHELSSITVASHDELDEKLYSLFFTTAAGYVFEYPITKKSDSIAKENWVNHKHPPYARVARGIPGLIMHVGRIMFPLDDGRLAELHFSGHGGENSGPNYQLNARKKTSFKYIWSILDAPESEGWNAEYCSEERGPTNCILGIKDEPNDLEKVTIRRQRRGSQTQEHYLPPTIKAKENFTPKENWIKPNYHLRVMHESRSFFLVSDNGLTFEYLFTENIWLWLRNEHTTAMKGAIGNYNGSLFMVDEHGSLLIRERKGVELSWINCTAMVKGRQVNSGPPWDGITGKAKRMALEDALFFVSKSGRLMQFTVAQRKYKWKDCRYPANIKIASIIDQEMLRENIIFVVGRNGRLYQYNKITELWHAHYQSQHLILSRLPGTAMRSATSSSLAGSIFMVSEDDGLVEYQWRVLDGWNWIEHGKPSSNVILVGSTGPSFEGNQLFLIGSDGNVYLRYLEQTAWKWKNFGFPYIKKEEGKEVCLDQNRNEVDRKCDSKVASTRPIAFAEDSVIFELRDGRLAEMRRLDTQWVWSRTIGTPTSLCSENYWAALAA